MWALRIVGLLSVVSAALVLAFIVTPLVSVTTFGQTVKVGAVAPGPSFGWSGPGQADLFGEGPVSTVQSFAGPVRPRIVWQQFDRNADAGHFIQVTDDGGRRTVTTASAQVGADLAQGWLTYFGRLVVVAIVLSLGFYLVLRGTVSVARAGKPHPLRLRRHLIYLSACAVATVFVTVGCGALSVLSARNDLANVSSLADLTGTAPLVPVPAPVGTTRTGIDVVVLGDSTAAGVGNTPLTNPTDLDKTCGRSRDAYAAVLQSATGAGVLNLACSSATIAAGVLGAQHEGSTTVPPQVGVLKSVPAVQTVILSVGANDMGWSDFLQYCYGLARCDDQASDSLFQSRLDAFRIQYAQLLQQLSDLPSHPQVIVVAYYDPFGDTFDCAALKDPETTGSATRGFGFGADEGQDNQATKITQKIDPLRSELVQMNDVLSQGAGAFGYTTVVPSFEGHALCTDQPWVQGLSARYPFHPNAAGELAITAALLPHLTNLAN